MYKNQLQIIVVMALAMMSLTSCEAIGGIFKAGVWVGVLIVVGIIILLIWLFTRGGKK